VCKCRRKVDCLGLGVSPHALLDVPRSGHLLKQRSHTLAGFAQR
jgi:hypothetical protein